MVFCPSLARRKGSEEVWGGGGGGDAAGMSKFIPEEREALSQHVDL